jgi:DNA-binding response OmpR family regulator
MSVKNHQILVVEDDEITIHILNFLLSRENFEIRLAKDGNQALEIISSQPPTRAILLDVILPYMSGLDLIPRIRQNSQWRNVPIIVLTTDTTEQHVIQALDTGADDYVLKPFRTGELMARLRRVLRSQSTIPASGVGD